MKRATLLFIAALWLLPRTSPGYACSVECPTGYLGVCVERDGTCHCRCVVDASDGGKKTLKDLMREARASESAIDEAARRFQGYLDRGVKTFAFEVTDQETVFRISSREGTGSHSEVVEIE